MGVVLWYAVQFPAQGVSVSSDVYSGTWTTGAKIKIDSGVDRLTSFEVTFEDLPADLLAAVLAAHGTAPGPEGLRVPITIRLGYLDDPSSRTTVLEGFVDEITAARAHPPVGVVFTGHDRVSTRLRLARQVITEEKRVDAASAMIATSTAQPLEWLVGQVALGAEVEVKGKVGQGRVSPGEEKQGTYARSGDDAFELLRRMAEDFGAEVLLQSDGLQFGTAVRFPAGSTPGFTARPRVLAYVLTEDALVTADGAISARLAQFAPMSVGGAGRRVVDGRPDPTQVGAFDFTVLGEPRLAAGHLVVAGVEGYADPGRGFRVLDLTHSFSTKEGYTCAGRAAQFTADAQDAGNRRGTDVGRRATAVSVADRIKGIARSAVTGTPSLDAGRVTASAPDARTASLAYRPDRSALKVSPSVQQDIPADGPALPDKPMASPFAWHKVGLSVPVYEGMRALMAGIRGSRDDTVVDGFLWAQEPRMQPPRAEPGDWWLCLPTELSGTPALPAGKGVNDLVGADGRRVVEAVGLKITVGRQGCTDVGERPREGDPDTFLLTHSSGTRVAIDDQGAVTVDAGSKPVALTGGGVTLTLADGKVSIS